MEDLEARGVDFLEHNNRQIANKYAEYITGVKLRQFVAEKVHQYAGDEVNVFDGTAGSGQLEQFIKLNHFEAVEIQKKSCEALKVNYPNATVYNKSFFNYKLEIKQDCAVMNPPFSIKFKDLENEEKENIKKLFPWKKSGVVDDIFILKALHQIKRYGFFIAFPGIAYRGSEIKMRELIGNQLAELVMVENAFEDTKINVLFLVIDKLKTNPLVNKYIYNCKDGGIRAKMTEELENDYLWHLPREEAKQEDVNIDQVNKSLDDIALNNLKNHLHSQYLVIKEFNASINILSFIQDIRILCDEYEEKYKTLKRLNRKTTIQKSRTVKNQLKILFH